MKIGIVILAAGGSSRMGRPKQLLPFRGTTLLRHAIDTAAAVPGAVVVVVLGANFQEICGAVQDVMAVENPGWHEGMGGSIRVGLTALLEASPDADAVIFQTCDQPLLSTGILERLIAGHARGAAVVAAEYDGTIGVPASFGRAIFPELLALAGAGGAKRILEAHGGEVARVPFPEGALDIDTPADFERLQAAPGYSEKVRFPR